MRLPSIFSLDAWFGPAPRRWPGGPLLDSVKTISVLLFALRQPFAYENPRACIAVFDRVVGETPGNLVPTSLLAAMMNLHLQCGALNAAMGVAEIRATFVTAIPLIRYGCKTGDVDLSLRYLPRARWRIDTESIHGLLRACAKKGRLSDVMVVCREFRLPKCSFVVHALSRAALVAHRHRFAWLVVASALLRNVRPHPTTIYSLFRSSQACDSIRPRPVPDISDSPAIFTFVLACNLARGLPIDIDRIRDSPPLFWDRVLTAAAAARRHDVVVEMLKDVLDGDRWISRLAMKTLVQCLWEYPETLRDCLHRCAADTRTLNDVLLACNIAGRVDISIGLIEECKSISINPCTMNIMLMAAVQTHRSSAAVFELWQNSKVGFDAFTISILALACARDPDCVRGALRALGVYGLTYKSAKRRVPLFAIPSMVIALARANRYDLAQDLFDECVTKRGVAADQFLLDTMRIVRRRHRDITDGIGARRSHVTYSV